MAASRRRFNHREDPFRFRDIYMLLPDNQHHDTDRSEYVNRSADVLRDQAAEFRSIHFLAHSDGELFLSLDAR